MSLINQMLRDLDERQASTLERGGLTTQVRALPRARQFPWLSALPVVIGTSIGVAGLWLVFRPTTTTAVSPVTQPQATMSMPTLVVPMPADSVVAPAGERLQMDYTISRPTRPVESQTGTAAPQAPPAAPSTAVAQIDKQPRLQAAETADGEYRKAMAAHRQGRSNEALEGFQAALRIDPRHVAARQAMLSLFLEQHRWSEAQAAAADGLAINPAQAGWAMILARLQVEQGQVIEAERTMASHAVHGERNADYLAFHGLLLEKLQRPLEARTAFLKARELGSLPPEMADAIEQRLR
jgi:MSHA biogenesis protein MshN